MFSEEEEPATLGDGDLGHGLHPLHGAAVTADHHLPLDGECLLEDLYLPEELLGILGCVIACFVPYRPLLNVIYGLNGYLGFILVAFMIWNDVKVWRNCK